jgi:hypothetical protein
VLELMQLPKRDPQLEEWRLEEKRRRLLSLQLEKGLTI